MRPATWFVVPEDAHAHEETWFLHDVTEQELTDILDVLKHNPSFRFLRSSSGHKTSVPQPCRHYQWLKISNVLQFLSIVTLSITTSSSSSIATATTSSVPSDDYDGLQPPVPVPVPATSTRRTTRRRVSNPSNQQHDPNPDNSASSSRSRSSTSNPKSNSQSNPQSLTLVARSVSASIVPAFVPLPVGAALAVLFFWVPFPDWYTPKHTPS